jgi:hypothetical protein
VLLAGLIPRPEALPRSRWAYDVACNYARARLSVDEQGRQMASRASVIGKSS